jgi:hypothetical protein
LFQSQFSKPQLGQYHKSVGAVGYVQGDIEIEYCLGHMVEEGVEAVMVRLLLEVERDDVGISISGKEFGGTGADDGGCRRRERSGEESWNSVEGGRGAWKMV